MKDWIIVDSGCDLTPGLRERLGAVSIPLTVTLGDREFTDDETLDLREFMAHMKACKEKAGSASPSPALYCDAFLRAGRAFAVTLSEKLSGSYAHACLGKTMAEEESSADIHIFDSKSASAGQLLVAMKIRELLDKGMEKANIIGAVERFIANMKTYFVLERHDNLEKSGRLSRITGKIINVLNIKLIMGSDGDGSITLFAKPRGREQMLKKLMSMIADSGRDMEQERLVISHCNNPGLAEQLAELVKSRFRFGEVVVVPAGGLVSLYADDGGIVLAF